MPQTKPRRPRKQRLTPAQLAIRTGDEVLVRLESGVRMATRARSEPYDGEDGRLLVEVEGMDGGVDLSRVETRKEAE